MISMISVPKTDVDLYTSLVDLDIVEEIFLHKVVECCLITILFDQQHENMLTNTKIVVNVTLVGLAIREGGLSLRRCCEIEDQQRRDFGEKRGESTDKFILIKDCPYVAIVFG